MGVRMIVDFKILFQSMTFNCQSGITISLRANVF